MKFSACAAAVGLACLAMAPVYAADQQTTTTVTVSANNSSFTPEANTDGKSNYQTATGTNIQVVGTADQKVDLSISGEFNKAFLAQSAGTIDISNFNSVSIDLTTDRHNLAGGGGLVAWGKDTSISMHDVGDVYIKTYRKADQPDQDPIPLHTLGGSIAIESSGNVMLATEGSGNVIMAQTSEYSGASVSIEAEGDITLTGPSSSVTVGTLVAPKDGTVHNASVVLRAKNISLTSTRKAGINLYDTQWQAENIHHGGNSSVTIEAVKDVVINAATYGVLSQRKYLEGSTSSQALIKAGGRVSISAGQTAIVTQQSNNENSVVNEVSIMSPAIDLANTEMTSQLPAVYVVAKTNVSLQGINGGATKVNIDSANGIAIGNSGIISTKNAELNINSGRIASSNGEITLTDSTLTLAEGSTAAIGTLSGSDSAIVVNSLDAGTVTVGQNNSKGLKVVASSAVTAKEGAEKVAKTLRTAASVTGDNAVTYAGEGTGLTSDYLIDENGALSYSNGEAESAILSSAKHFNAANIAQWRYEINHLSDRLGDVRNQQGAVGSWARVYGADAKVDDSVSTEMRTNTIQVGADVKVGDYWIVGGAFGYTDGDGQFNNGEASSDGYTLSAYGTAFFPCGGYVDLIGRVGRISSDISLDGASTSYDNTTFGLSAEVGYKWDITKTFFVTPQVELSYGYVKGDDYTLAQQLGDVRVEQDDFTTLVGRVGFQAGANFPENAGQIYLTASINHDFQGDTDADAFQGVESRHISEDLGGTWFSYGVGAQIRATDSMFFYGSLTRANGSSYTEDFRYSAGMRVVW